MNPALPRFLKSALIAPAIFVGLLPGKTTSDKRYEHRSVNSVRFGTWIAGRKRVAPRIASMAIAALFALSALSAEPQPQQAKPQDLDFSPPPVPEFMLRRPAKPLTLEEMKKQADEASRRARAEKGKRTSSKEPPAKPGEEGAK